MRGFHTKTKFRKDLKRQDRRGKDLTKLQKVLDMLAMDGRLPLEYSPHPLRGEYVGSWECHIEPDWLLIYAVSDEEVMLIRTGTHSDLFDE